MRVGFWSLHPGNNKITTDFNIPVKDNNDGRFVDGDTSKGDAATTTSRSMWYTHLFGAAANDGTPLRVELKAAGEYFKGSADTGPYGPEPTASQFSCRQNFTILTTDGYWNDGDPSGIGDVDGTAQSTITGAPKQKGDPNQTYTYSPTKPYSDGSAS